MNFKRELWILGILVVLLGVFVFFLPDYNNFVPLYDKFIYYPVQSFRNIVFGALPFSLGDLLYVLGGLGLLLVLLRWIYFIRKFGAYKERLAASFLRTVNAALLIYLLFFLGWGANYNKPPLHEIWGLHGDATHNMAPAERKAKDLASITAFNKFLVDKLNSTAPQYRAAPFGNINDRARAYYRVYTNSKVKENGLGIKPALFGFFLERMAVEGYYNPFTGEGQINSNLPAFIMPFLVCHEMAHQAGIAAEGDANLLAYALGTTVNDPTFNYSSYLNIWLYANTRLYHRDSITALQLESQLNPLTKAHIDTLEQINRKYHNDMARYSTDIYDSYLKMQQQKDGIRSYGSVTSAAWQLELKRKNARIAVIKIP